MQKINPFYLEHYRQLTREIECPEKEVVCTLKQISMGTLSQSASAVEKLAILAIGIRISRHSIARRAAGPLNPREPRRAIKGAEKLSHAPIERTDRGGLYSA